MGTAEGSDFEGLDGRGIAVGLAEDLGVFPRFFGEQDDFAGVVEKAGGEALFGHRLIGGFRGGDALRDGGHADAVVPERGDMKGDGGFPVELREDVDGQGEGADGFDTDERDGLAEAGDAAVGSDEGGVGELENLGGHADVFRDDLFDAPERGHFRAQRGG